MSLFLWRHTVAPGSFTYAADPAGQLDPAGWVMRDAAGREFAPAARQLIRRSAQSWDARYHHALDIPSDVPLGAYTLSNDGSALAEPLLVSGSEFEDYRGVRFTCRLPTREYTLFQDCTIDLAAGGHADHSAMGCMYLRCHFRGIGDPTWTCPVRVRAPGSVFLLDCTVEDAVCGPFISTEDAVVSDVFISGLSVRHCYHGENASQGLGVEGKNRLVNSAILHTRILDCAGEGIQFWGPGTRDVTIRDFRVAGGLGMWILGEDHDGLAIMDGEIDGGVLCCVPGAAAFQNVAVLPTRPTRGSHFAATTPRWPAVRSIVDGRPIVLEGVREYPAAAA